MASMQQSFPMQPSGGPQAGPQAQTITKEYLQQTFMRYNQLKSQGVPENDQELLRCRKILAMVRAKQEAAHKMRGQAQAQAQSQSPGMSSHGMSLNQPSNGAPTTNPSTKAMQSTLNGAPSHPASNGAHPPSADGLLSKEQQQTLRLQLSAFNYLQKNVPIPPAVHQQLFGAQHGKKPSIGDQMAAAVQLLDESTKAPGDAISNTGDKATDKSTQGSAGRHKFQSFKDPHALLKAQIRFLEHSQRPFRQMVPSIMPLGIDPEKAREERSVMLYNRISARKAEIESMPANIGSWDPAQSDSPVDDGKLKLKLLIEKKMLDLWPKQQAMRQNIGREMLHSDTLAMTANRAMYRRVKKQSLREARITEKLEKQQRDAHENKEKKKHNDFLRSAMQHAEDVKNSANQQRQRIQKLGRIMVQTHANIEKEEQKRIERTAKQRLQALKANDEETYLKLLGQAKDSRISHLLGQTDGFLKQLANSVKAQQRGHDREGEEQSDEDEASDEEGNEKVDYYEVAHRVKEEVKAQATILVGGTLKEYQIKGLQWMLSLYNNKLNGILADEMGLGKTIQTISLITYLIEKKREPGPFLVIVPLSTLTNWNNEFDKWAPSVNKIVYKGPPNQRKAAAQQIRFQQFQVLLTTYEFIIKDRPLLSKVRWLHMIVDEGHRMKNANSKLSLTINQYYHTKYRLILTGTPLQNSLPELWALLNFVLPNIFKSVRSFDEWFNTPFANTGGQDKMELTEEEQLLVIRRLHKVLRPFLLRRLKKDVEKDLPDKTERVIKCNFSSLQAKLYKQLVSHNRLMVSDGKGGKTGMRGLSNMLMQLRKLCNHPFVFEEVEDQVNPGRGTNDMLWRTAGKFELLDRVLPKFKATGHRVLMFFQMTQIMNIMEDFLRLRGLTYLRLDGSTKADDRSELLRLFNAPDSPYFCFLLSTRAGGLGLNLQTADTVIIYDSDWNPHQDLQAQDRAHRIGQKNEVRILRLISSNSVEEKILERANFKLDMDGKVIQAGKFDNKSTNDERDEMLRVMLESAEAAEAMEQDEMDDDDLNLMMMRNESELELFKKMDQERIKNDPYGPGRKLPRLLGEDELPEIYMQEDIPVVEEIEANAGRGARERTKVKYDDGLTEEQWLEAVDADDDTIEDAIARKQKRIAKRATNKEKRLRADFGLGDSPAGSRDSSEEPDPEPAPEPVPKKRGRKPKRKLEDEPEAPPPKKRGRQAKIAETLSPEMREKLQSILNAVHESLNDLEEESTEPGIQNRGIIDPFIELPPRNDYPSYYQVIKNPICMDQIAKKINKKQYQGIKEFRNDIGLLCNNCREYNEDGSLLYQDANLIEDTCLKKIKEETEKHSEFANWEDADSQADGMSTRPISTAGTPQPRISLKLGKKNASRAGTESALQSDDE